MDNDFQFYVDNLDQLYARYPNQYIVVKDSAILGVYSDMDEAVRITAKTEPLGSFIVQRCVKSIEDITTHYTGVMQWEAGS